jgi:hypothetical protein
MVVIQYWWREKLKWQDDFPLKGKKERENMVEKVSVCTQDDVN